MMILRAPVSQLLCKTALVQRTSTRGFHASVAWREKTMKLLPTQVVVAAYTKLDAADEAADALKEAMKKREVMCQNIAIIRKNEEGKLKITELGKIKKSHGAVAGALMWGTAVLMVGPFAVAAGAVGGALGGALGAVGARTGAAVGTSLMLQGTVLAHMTSTVGGALGGAYGASKIETLDQDKMNNLGNILEAEQSALIAVFDQVLVPKEELENAGVNVARDEILSKAGKDIGTTLREGNDIAYMFAVTDDAEFVATRVVTGDEAADIKGIVINGDAVDEDSDEPEEEITYEVIDGEVVDEGGEKQK